MGGKEGGLHEVKEERKGSADQSSSDFALAMAKQAHLQAREEVSQNTDINLPEKTDSGLWSQRAPSESELYKGTGNLSSYLLE